LSWLHSPEKYTYTRILDAWLIVKMLLLCFKIHGPIILFLIDFVMILGSPQLTSVRKPEELF